MNSWPPTATLAFALAVITTGVNLHAPLYAAYAQHDGHGVLATTVAFSLYVAGVMPVLLALGGLSDRIGRRPVMLIALALSAAGTSLMLVFPHLAALALARWILGVGTALMSATAVAYMSELAQSRNAAASANWVTASTSFGFGLGPALTSACLLLDDSATPASFWLHLGGTGLAFVLLSRLPEPAGRLASRPAVRPMLQLPLFPRGASWFGGGILLCWATTGVIISVLPAVLAAHRLSAWSGLSTLLAISCGLLFQPIARRLEPARSARIGLMTLLPAYGLLAWGALDGELWAVLLGSFAASSACYGFVYLGGLGGVAALAGEHKARACAGFFLMAYIGFSLPVIFTGLVADAYGRAAALTAFGVFLVLGVGFLLSGWSHSARVLGGADLLARPLLKTPRP